jgi:hypothetical protein
MPEVVVQTGLAELLASTENVLQVICTSHYTASTMGRLVNEELQRIWKESVMA